MHICRVHIPTTCIERKICFTLVFWYSVGRGSVMQIGSDMYFFGELLRH